MSKYKHTTKENRRLYSTWYGMKQRCYNPNHDHYGIYGKRGITICDEWLNDFDVFAEWAIANGFDENAPYGECTIDRIDVNGNYEPSNCRFLTLKEQSRNRRNNVVLSFNGEEKTIAEWSEVTNIPYHVIFKRINLGWSIEDALTEPVKQTTHLDVDNVKEDDCLETLVYTPGKVARLLGIRNETVYELLESGNMPAFKIGNRYKIPKNMFHQWLEQTTNRETEERRATIERL